MTFSKVLRPLFLSLALIGTSRAQSTTAPASASSTLGPRFESLAAGIALRPPTGVKTIRGELGSADVVSFVNDERRWTVRLSRVLIDKGKYMPLTLWKDKDNVERAGLLEWTVENFKVERPGTEILRQEVTNIKNIPVGLVAAKFSFGMDTNLMQEAVIQGGSEVQYYLLSLTCPAPKTDDLMSDPNVQRAAETFSAMLDSVELLDQTTIREDQLDRLRHSQSLYPNIKGEDKARKVVAHEQWFRYQRNGRDIGYSYVLEELGAHDVPHKGEDAKTGPPGVLIGIHSGLVPDVGVLIESESWLFSAYDCKSEAFTSVIYQQDDKNVKTTVGEVGSSRWRERPIRPAPAEIGARPAEPETVEQFRLEVTKLGMNVSNEPIVRDLPPYYLPLAYAHLLPRFVALRGKQTYLFTTWVSDAAQVIYRYIDVDAERDVTLIGRRYRAIPVRDRVGLEGSTTTHYISPEGKYLGSENADTKLTIVSTDAKTINDVFPKANLSRPAARDGR